MTEHFAFQKIERNRRAVEFYKRSPATTSGSPASIKQLNKVLLVESELFPTLGGVGRNRRYTKGMAGYVRIDLNPSRPASLEFHDRAPSIVWNRHIKETICDHGLVEGQPTE